MFSILLLLFCAIVSVLSNPAVKFYQCKSNDNPCVIKAANKAFQLVLEENAEIGAELLDPLYQTVIEGNLSILKYKFYNTTTIGFKTCSVYNAKYDEVKQTVHLDTLCERFALNGQYDIYGKLISHQIEGYGDYSIITKKYRLAFDLELMTVTGKDGKTYRIIKNFKIGGEALEPVVYDFKNLFNGQKDAGDIVLNFANNNWKKVADQIQGPIALANTRKIINNANKYLETVPIEDYIIVQ